jgi:hypothetical protein
LSATAADKGGSHWRMRIEGQKTATTMQMRQAVPGTCLGRIVTEAFHCLWQRKLLRIVIIFALLFTRNREH